ncbi:hypothetical protein CHUAL_001771 [Chamberlinius hualienensis]
MDRRALDDVEAEVEEEDCPSSAIPTPPPPPLHAHQRCPVHNSGVLRREGSGQSCSTVSVRTTNSTSSGQNLNGNKLSDEQVGNRHIPALKRRGLKTSTIRQHYYPEGGWGWLICACAFMIHVLTTGLQMAYGVLYINVLKHFGEDYVVQAGWLGVLCYSVSLFLSPLVVALCRRKSTRLTAVFGGLSMALASLFTSFAQQLHQVFLSYGLVLGVGVGLTRQASDLMIGQYFKRRREVVEVIVHTGSGIGISLFSVFFHEAINSLGWRLGLQVITGVLFSAFILGIFYRSASLYHPQRRAILHLKNHQKKVKEKNRSEEKPPYFDFTTVKTRTLQIIMLSTGVSSLGIYSPIFYLSLHCRQEGIETNSILLLQTFLGFAFALGNCCFGLIVVRHNEQCSIARQYLTQAALFGLTISILILASIHGYHSYVLFTWIYGLFLGGYHFSLKVFTLEKMRARYFTRAWGFVQWSQALPVLFGVPITGYINRGHSLKTGFYFASAFAFIGASCLFLMNVHRHHLKHRKDQTFGVTFDEMKKVSPDEQMLQQPTIRPAKSISFASSVDLLDDETMKKVSDNQHDADLYMYDDVCGEICVTSIDKPIEDFVYFEVENNKLKNEQIDNHLVIDKVNISVQGQNDSQLGSSTSPSSSASSDVQEVDEAIGEDPKDELNDIVTPLPIKHHQTLKVKGKSYTVPLPKPPTITQRNITLVEEMTTSV